MDTHKILQIIPADGWVSMYEEEDENGEKVIVEYDTVCFALVEYYEDDELTGTYVDAIDWELYIQSAVLSNSSRNFLGVRKAKK